MLLHLACGLQLFAFHRHIAEVFFVVPLLGDCVVCQVSFWSKEAHMLMLCTRAFLIIVFLALRCMLVSVLAAEGDMFFFGGVLFKRETKRNI